MFDLTCLAHAIQASASRLVGGVVQCRPSTTRLAVDQLGGFGEHVPHLREVASLLAASC